jgi:hypothetical protein
MAFCRDALRFKFRNDDGFALVLDAHGTMLYIAKAAAHTLPQHTVLGWEVVDICDAISQLRQRGASFEGFPQMQQDESGVWTVPHGDKVTWFKDPDGNVLSLSQHHYAGSDSQIRLREPGALRRAHGSNPRLWDSAPAFVNA